LKSQSNFAENKCFLKRLEERIDELAGQESFIDDPTMQRLALFSPKFKIDSVNAKN